MFFAIDPANPDDARMTTGLALFIADDDRPRAVALRDFVNHSDSAEAWEGPS